MIKVENKPLEAGQITTGGAWPGHPRRPIKFLRTGLSRQRRCVALESAMDAEIIAMLGQDGVTNGAIYALLALALVLVFAVTRSSSSPGSSSPGAPSRWRPLEAAISRHHLAAGRLRRATLAVDLLGHRPAQHRALRRCGTWPIRSRWRAAAVLPLADLPTAAGADRPGDRRRWARCSTGWRSSRSPRRRCWCC